MPRCLNNSPDSTISINVLPIINGEGKMVALIKPFLDKVSHTKIMIAGTISRKYQRLIHCLIFLTDKGIDDYYFRFKDVEKLYAVQSQETSSAFFSELKMGNNSSSIL